MSQNVKAVATRDFDDVIDTANQYVEGLRTGSADRVAKAFHADAVMYGYTDGKLLGGPISNLYGFINDNGKAPDIATRLDVLSITPTTAVVRVDMENDAIGADYNDFLTLIKMEGQWQVVAKVYHQFDK